MSQTIFLYGITLALAVKFSIDHKFGAWTYCSQGSYSSYTNARYAAEKLSFKVTPNFYRSSYVIKWLALPLLPFGGWATAVSALLLSMWFFLVEIQFDYKHHTIFLGVCCAILALAAPGGLLWGTPISENQARLISYLCLALVVQVYLSSALIKAISPSFRSGRVLSNLFEYLSAEQHRFRYRETYIPVRLISVVSASTNKAQAFKSLAFATIAVEILTAVLLAIPTLWSVGVLVGTLMHLSFNAILPVRLLPFLIAIFSLYWMVPH